MVNSLSSILLIILISGTSNQAVDQMFMSVQVLNSTCNVNGNTDCRRYYFQICYYESNKGNCMFNGNMPVTCLSEYQKVDVSSLRGKNGSTATYVQDYVWPNIEQFTIGIRNEQSTLGRPDFKVCEMTSNRTTTNKGIIIKAVNEKFRLALKIEAICSNPNCYGQICETCPTTALKTTLLQPVTTKSYTTHIHQNDSTTRFDKPVISTSLDHVTSHLFTNRTNISTNRPYNSTEETTSGPNTTDTEQSSQISGDSISTGAYVGIVIGAIVVILLFLVIVRYNYKKYSRSNRQTQPGEGKKSLIDSENVSSQDEPFDTSKTIIRGTQNQPVVEIETDNYSKEITTKNYSGLTEDKKVFSNSDYLSSNTDDKMQHEAVLSNERTSNESTKRRKHKRKKKRERSSTTEKNSLTSDERVTDRTEKSQTSLQNEACTLVNKHSSTNKENSKDELPEKVHSDHSQTNDLSEKSVDHEDSLADDVDKSKKIVKKEEHVESRRSIADDSISSNSIQNETFAGLNNNSRLLESAMNGVSDATPSTSRETRKGNDSSRHDLTENSVQTLVENKMENIKQELQKVRKELMDYNNVTNQVRVDMSGLEENMKLDTKHHAKQIEEKLMNQTTQLQQGLTQLEEIIKKSTQTEEVLEHIKANRNKIDDQKQEIKDMKNTLLKLQEDISRLLNLQSERENLSKTIKEDSNTQSTPQTENLPSSSTVQNITNQTDIDNRENPSPVTQPKRKKKKSKRHKGISYMRKMEDGTLYIEQDGKRFSVAGNVEVTFDSECGDLEFIRHGKRRLDIDVSSPGRDREDFD